MTTPSMHTLVLGAALAASMGIGYALGAQPHMYQSIGLLQSARGELVPRPRTRAATANAPSA